MVFVIFHLKPRIERKTKINIKKSMAIEHAAPLLETLMAHPLKIHHNSHGMGNLKIEKIYAIIFQVAK